VVKDEGVKKGLVMKSLRAALMGDMKGPDLMDLLADSASATV
jgi:glutamyl-tRNA synthetase